jgi:predicted dehydrogenase
VAPLYMEAIHRLDFVQMEALAEVNMELAQRRAEQLQIPRAYDDYRELLEDPRIVAVHILLPNSLHFEVTKAALEAGKHVIAEKPLTTTVEEARELVVLERQTDLVTAVNFHYRYFNLVQQAKEMVAKGELGKVRLVQGSYLQDWLLLETDYNWRLDPKVGGRSQAVADIGSHWFDLIEHVAGKRVARVYAHMCTLVPERKRALKESGEIKVVRIQTEDYATILFEFEDDTVGTMTVSQVSPGRKNRLYFEIGGSQAAVAWNWEMPNELWVGRRDEPNQKVLRTGDFKEGWRGGIYRLMKNIYAAILAYRQGRPTEGEYPTFEDGLRSMLIVDAVLRSRDSSTWVEIGSV